MKIIIFIFTVLVFAAPVFAGEVAQAVRDADYDQLIRLLKAGKSPNECDNYETPLMIAANQMDVKAAKILIDNKADVNFKIPETGMTPLMYLATFSDYYNESAIPIMKLLIHSGARINDIDASKKTAIMYAVEQGTSIEILKFLLQNKPDLTMKSDNNDTALYLAVLTENATYVDLLMKAGADASITKRENKFVTAPIHTAVEKGNIDIVRAILANGGDVNIRTSGGFGGMTPLHKAVEARDVEIVKLLLQYKATVNIKDDAGYTPLRYAYQGGGDELAEIIGLLKKAGAK